LFRRSDDPVARQGPLVTSRERSPQLANVPTAAEAGVSDLVIDSWFGLVVPAGTPADIFRLNAEVVRIGAQTSLPGSVRFPFCPRRKT
jgi:hypothetical protein